jgi:hypothetical protein
VSPGWGEPSRTILQSLIIFIGNLNVWLTFKRQKTCERGEIKEKVIALVELTLEY